MHESLKVYLKDRFVGWLSHESTGDVFSFKYDDAYLADPSDGALSFTLPLGTETFDSVRTYRFFANLLPPQVVRQRLGASLHLSRNNVFGFLKAIGGDCAGAVSLYPAWMKPTPQDVENIRELSEDEAVEILRHIAQQSRFLQRFHRLRALLFQGERTLFLSLHQTHRRLDTHHPGW